MKGGKNKAISLLYGKSLPDTIKKKRKLYYNVISDLYSAGFLKSPKIKRHGNPDDIVEEKLSISYKLDDKWTQKDIKSLLNKRRKSLSKKIEIPFSLGFPESCVSIVTFYETKKFFIFGGLKTEVLLEQYYNEWAIDNLDKKLKLGKRAMKKHGYHLIKKKEGFI